MVPSDERRRWYLKLCSKKLIQMPFYAFGVIMMIAAVVVLIVTRGRSVTGHGNINGVPQDTVISMLMVSAILYAVGVLFVIIAKFMIGGIYKYVSAGAVFEADPYNRIPKMQLLAEAAAEISRFDPQYMAEINGDWIDVTWNWFDMYGGDFTGISRGKQIYKKMFLIHDDFTYQELDMFASADIDVGAGRLHFHESFNCGHLKRKEFGMDFNSAGTSWKMDTQDLTDAMHRWLAEKGYTMLPY